jgi:fido (protein-threonine AMPylation protein)
MWKSNFDALKNMNPLKAEFIRQFFFDPAQVRLSDKTLIALDNQITNYETGVPFDVRQYLLSRSEVLASLAISKAEQTNLLKETDASEIQRRLNADPDYDPLKDKDVKNEKDRLDRLELANIMKVYRRVSAGGIKAKDLSTDLLKELHVKLSAGLDTFDYLPGFDRFYAGRIRNSNHIAVRDETTGLEYRPVDHRQVKENIESILEYYRKNPSITSLNILNIALYAVHPFHNGNKRLCRILEHGLLRDLGLNKGNAFSHIYYYHKQIRRFYDELMRSLVGLNFIPAINFSREAIFYSQLSVFKFGIEQKRKDLAARGGKSRYPVYKTLIKNKAMQYKDLRHSNQDPAESTFSKWLAEGVEEGILNREQTGKRVFYSINLDLQEEHLAREVIESQLDQLAFIPSSYVEALYSPRERGKFGNLLIAANPEEPNI